MCKCNPSIRTPFCGKGDCVWPNQLVKGNVVGKSKFKIFSTTGVEYQPIDIGRFPGGEVRVRLPAELQVEELKSDECRIEAMLFNSEDVMILVMLTDALREAGMRKIRLTMPYIPYARQDRVCNPGEALSMRAFARIINSLEFSSIVVYDAHSDVSTALLERSINRPRSDIMKDHKVFMAWYNQYRAMAGVTGLLLEEKTDPIYIVSPDAGAVKKSYEMMKTFPQFNGIIFAEKLRDLATGQITKTVVRDLPADIANARLLVCDDICDGGRTFIELGKVLRPYCKELNLYVTHGIFSQGKQVLEPYFDNVWAGLEFSDYQNAIKG